MKKLVAGCIGLFFACNSYATANTSHVNVFAYASTTVTTGAYFTLLNSTPFTVSKLQVCDTSGQVLKIASGIAGSELDLFTTTVSSCVIVPIYLLAGQRLSIKSISASASTGFNTVSFIQ